MAPTAPTCDNLRMQGEIELTPEPSRTPPPALPGAVALADDEETLLGALCADLMIHANNCIRAFGDFHLACSAGIGMEPLFRRLMLDPAYRLLPWQKTQLWLVDECLVPWDDERSRGARLREMVGEHSDIPPEQLHTVPIDERRPDAVYEDVLRECLGWREKGHDRLDCAVLELEPGGAIGGLFPGPGAHAPSDQLVALTRPRDGGPERVTMTLRLLNASRFVGIIAGGQDRLPLVSRLAGPRAQAADIPALGLRPLAGELRWYLDRPACPA